MEKIIIGFDNRKISDAILNELRKNGQGGIQFSYKNSKIAIRDALIKETESSTLLLMEKCGFEKWTISEIAQLRDMTTMHIIPILTEESATPDNMQMLYNYGITDAVIMDKKKGLRVSDVARLIRKPRNLKDARAYYHITTVADSTIDSSSTLTDDQIEELKAALWDTTYGGEGSTFGTRYKQLALSLNVEQNMYFINHIDGEILYQLQQTEEFYDVCDILMANGAKITYTRPKELQKNETAAVEQIVINSTETVSGDEDFSDSDIEQEYNDALGDNISGYNIEQPDISEEITEDELLINPSQDEDFGFHEGDIDESLMEEQVISLSKETSTVEDDVQRMLDEEELKEAEEELAEKKTRTFAYIIVAIALIVVCLIVSFIIITIKRSKEQELRKASMANDYNVTYTTEEKEEPAEFKELNIEEETETTEGEYPVTEQEPGDMVSENEITDGGEINLVIASEPTETNETPQNMTTYVAEEHPDENEEETATGETSTVKNSITSKTLGVLNDRTGTTAAGGIQNVISGSGLYGTSVSSNSQTIAIPSYVYRPAALSSDYANINSKFKQGAKITGLELINVLNSENGQDCTVTLKDGTVISVKAKNAGIGDIQTGSEYLIDTSGKTLNFIQQ